MTERQRVYDNLKRDQFLLKMVSMGFLWWYYVSVIQYFRILNHLIRIPAVDKSGSLTKKAFCQSKVFIYVFFNPYNK